MYAEERQRLIVSLAHEHDRVAVAELAGRFGVTTETIRRDLELLDERGLLQRVHGGALPARRGSSHPSSASWSGRRTTSPRSPRLPVVRLTIYLPRTAA